MAKEARLLESKAVYEFDCFRVDPTNRLLLRDGEVVPLTAKVFDLLLVLVESDGRLLEKEEVMRLVWPQSFVEEGNLTRHVSTLRKALGETPKTHQFIVTVPGYGYKFVAPIKELRETPSITMIAEQTVSTTVVEEEISLPAIIPVPRTLNSTQKDRIARRVTTLIPAAIALTLIAIIAFTIWKIQTRPAPTEMTTAFATTQVTTSPGLDFYPTLSPDGRSVAYSSDHSGSFEIYARQLTPGAREIQITSDGQQNISPAWSPDGQHIAYYSMNRGGIWLVPSSGGVGKQLSEFGSRPTWSPDSSLIAFQSREISDVLATIAMPPSTIWVVSASGGEPVPLTQAGVPAGGHGTPSWSPNGRRIAFASSGASIRPEIWSVSANGTDLKMIYRGGEDPIYSPDGEFIYFAGSARASNYGLFKIQVSVASAEPSGDPIQIASTPIGPFGHLTMSADGKKLAYTAQIAQANIWSIAISSAVGEATGTPVPLTNETNRKGSPSFSGDGRRIAFTDWKGGTPAAIWVMAADGTGARQLTADFDGQRFPSWFPDGDKVAFLSYRQQRPEVASAAVDTGRVAPVVDVGADVAFPRLSPDGSQIAFNSARTGNLNVWVVPIAGGEPHQVTFDQELMAWPCWSPDGKFFAVEMKRGDDTHIAIVPTGGGATKQMTFEHGESWPHSWSPDGDKIAFAGYRKGVWNIWWVSRTTGAEKQVTNNTKLNAYIRYPAWSPLGNQIVYEYGQTTGNIWLMDLK